MENIGSLIRDITAFIKSYGAVFLLFIGCLITRLEVYNVYLIDLFCVWLIFSRYITSYNDSFSRLLLLFSTAYSLVLFINNSYQSLFEVLGYMLGPLTFYLFGKHIIKNSRTDSQIISFILVVVICSCLGLYILTIHDINEFGLINVYRTIGGEDSTSSATATLLGLVASVGFGGVAYPLISKYPIKSIKSVLFIACVVLSLLSVIHLINRTGIVVLCVAIIVVTFYKVEGNYKKILPVIMIVLGLYFLLVFLGVINNEVLEAYEARNIGEENINTANGRTERWLQAIPLMFQHPFGWSSLTNAKYCHSLWFDTARTAGIIPFFLIVIIGYISIKRTIRLFKIRDNIVVGMLLSFFVCMFISASMEPVLEGASSYFYLMCLFWGMQTEYYNNYIRLNNEN